MFYAIALACHLTTPATAKLALRAKRDSFVSVPFPSDG